MVNYTHRTWQQPTNLIYLVYSLTLHSFSSFGERLVAVRTIWCINRICLIYLLALFFQDFINSYLYPVHETIWMKWVITRRLNYLKVLSKILHTYRTRSIICLNILVTFELFNLQEVFYGCCYMLSFFRLLFDQFNFSWWFLWLINHRISTIIVSNMFFFISCIIYWLAVSAAPEAKHRTTSTYR